MERELSPDLYHLLDKTTTELFTLLHHPPTLAKIEAQDVIFWKLACKKHFQLSPLREQSGRDLFYSEYLFQKAFALPSTSYARRLLLKKAAGLQNFHALATLCVEATDLEYFTTAVRYAEQASQSHGSPGYLLLSSTYLAFAAAIAKSSPATAKNHCKAALNFLYLAKTHEQASAIAIANTHCDLSQENIELSKQLILQLGLLSAVDLAHFTLPTEKMPLC